ncbi:hypothetical protein [Jiangella alkaliphila]|uniref:Uncharacterized protein n=1 Tax=Jiangella alkaliphila TaxID=419479 RepID=A0A1H2IE72_9ACTN|nr:hypothetical protein [Jiangella alkaliphila]SDU42158.1 hypothetical protein SAMN04488563_1630 [Jiangella alkaliphila]
MSRAEKGLDYGPTDGCFNLIARAALALVVLALVLAGCQSSSSSGGGGGGMNGTPHHIGEAWKKPLDFAVDAAPWAFAAFVLLAFAGALVHAHRRPRHGRHRAAG